jgi:microcin C transport system permease protein
VGVFLFSWLLPLFINDTAWHVRYDGKSYFPIFYELPIVSKIIPYYPSKIFYDHEFGLKGKNPVNYRKLKKHFEAQGKGNSVLLAPYEYSPTENNLTEYPDAEPPHRPDGRHWFGTDDRGRDVFARLAYGFNISMTFALLVTFFSYLIGVAIGGYLGYFGGIFDIVVQRIVEIWSSIPFLYAIMIVVSIVGEVHLGWLVVLLAAFGWMGMTYYIRGEFLREKAKDYVSAAISIGHKDHTIIFKHILPNSLTPVISFMPFAIVGNITSLVSLDFLGFGLAPPTPSWGEMMSQGMSHLKDPWLVFAPLGALFLTLMLVSFIGEAVREAFDPKQYSRLR